VRDAGGSDGNGEPLLALEGVTVRIRDRKMLEGTNWTIRRGEQWAVLGPNGSGKSTLVRTIAGELPGAAGTIRVADGQRLALVSFERQRQILLSDLGNDFARRFAGTEDDELTTRRLVESVRSEHGQEPGAEAARLLGFEQLLDRPFRTLSAGEMRKALIVRALAEKPSILILDEPFDGLDTDTRVALAGHLDALIARGRHLILVTHRADELIDGITHIMLLGDGRIEAAGKREALEANLPGVAGRSVQADEPPRRDQPRVRVQKNARRPAANGEALIEFREVSVRYGDQTVLDDLTWKLLRGERWGIFGPNGSGKTTILNLIFGDNLQAYANDIRIFGARKGSGESIWEIRKRIGILTPHLHLSYTRPVTVIEAVMSGFFDSVGLFRQPTDAQQTQAYAVLNMFGVSGLAERQFGQLSYGQQRIILLARALVKRPELLVLDEPCQGLDLANRQRVLAAIDAACDGEATSLLYVTHHPDEEPACLTHRLILNRVSD